MKLGLSTPQDFLALLVRRRWWIIAPFIALSCVAAVLTHFLPKSYVSETLILVRPRDVPSDFVKDLIAGTPVERLRVIQQTVLSRTNLIKILREFGDDLPELARLNIDQQVVKLRSQIGINFELEKRNGVEQPLSYFRISYRNQDPELAQKVATKLTTLFIEQDSQTRETQVFGTTEFLSSELAKVTDQMNESERKLKDFKLSRQFVLPDQREVNLRSLDRLEMEKKSNGEQMERLLTLRLNLERDLSETPTTVQNQVSTGNPGTDARLEEYLKAEEEYAQLSEKYTPNMPDVKMAKLHLDRLKAQLPPSALAALSESKSRAAQPAGPSVTSEPNPVYIRLQAQMAELNTELEIHQKDKAWIDSQIAKYNGRIEEIPKVELDIADVERQSGDLRKQYDELKNHLEQARLSESLESKQKGSQFVVVDPANYPLDPDKPDKTAVLLAGCCISLLVAIAFAAVVDIARQKVWSQSQIEALWGVPVLVEIPAIVTDADLAEARKTNYKMLLASAASVLVYGLCLYGVYMKHSFILRQLDPLLQKYIYKQ